MKTDRKWDVPVKQGPNWRLRTGHHDQYWLYVDTPAYRGYKGSWNIRVFATEPSDEEINLALMLFRLEGEHAFK